MHSVASHLQMTTLILTVGLQVISKPTVYLTVVYVSAMLLDAVLLVLYVHLCMAAL